MALIKLNNKAVSNATSFGSISSLGSMTFIKKLTASSSATLSFVDGSDGVVLDDTYKEYVFTYNNIHPATDNVNFSINFSTDGGSNYNVTKTSTSFRAYHAEDGGGGAAGYYAPTDVAQGTGNIPLSFNADGDNDSTMVAFLHLYDPSSTTFVKHFIGQANEVHDLPRCNGNYFAGYCNTTSAVNAVKFNGQYGEGTNGNIDSGKIILLGIN